jgi:hemolysin III
MPDRFPGQISWHYDRAEIIAHGVVHAIGICLGLIGAVTIVVMAGKIERISVAPILVYVIQSGRRQKIARRKQRSCS